MATHKIRPFALLLLATTVFAMSVGLDAWAQSRDPLVVQAGRDDKLKKRGAVRYYEPQFDLSDLPSYKPEQSVSGTLRLWGSNYFAHGGLGQVWEEAFRKYHPGVTFEDRLETTLIAIPGLALGLADIGPSRTITSDEKLMFQRLKNYHPTEISAVTGSLNVPGWSYALAIFVHKDNPISKLTIEQLDGIFGAERSGAFQGVEWNTSVARGPEKNLRTWKQLGVQGPCANKPINVYGYNLKYHIPLTFADRVMQGGYKWNEKLHEFTNYKNADGTTELEGKQVADAVSKDPCGIGYAGINFQTPQTKTVAVAPRGSSAYAELTLRNLRERSYPLFDEVFFYLDKQPGKKLDPKVREFVRFVLSREGQEAVQQDGKYLPLPARVVAEQLKKLD
jgi:phosphate transport system substrate-binding protein